MKANLLPISKEGWKYIAYSSFSFLIFYILDFSSFSFLFFILTVYFIYMFRNPERSIPMFQTASVVSPCDGVVKSITELEGDDFSYKIDIQSSYFDVGILRAPFSSKLEKILKTNGTRVSLKSKLYKDINENIELIFVDEDKNRVKIVHSLTQSLVSLYIDTQKSEIISQTSRYGFMNNGITSIYLPSNFRVNVNIGNELKASESLIGYFS